LSAQENIDIVLILIKLVGSEIIRNSFFPSVLRWMLSFLRNTRYDISFDIFSSTVESA